MNPEVVHWNETAVSWEFKLEAVRPGKERGVSVAQAACDLDVHENVLRKWIRELAANLWHPHPTPTLNKTP